MTGFNGEICVRYIQFITPLPLYVEGSEAFMDRVRNPTLDSTSLNWVCSERESGMQNLKTLVIVMPGCGIRWSDSVDKRESGDGGKSLACCFSVSFGSRVMTSR